MALIPKDVFIIVASTLVLIGVAMALRLTKLGKAMRAVVRQLGPRRLDRHRRRTGSSRSCGSSAACSSTLGGVFVALSEQVNWLMGFQLLLLMFAGVTLGGLGTDFGAMVGSIIVGVLVYVSTLWLAPELPNRGRAARAHRHPDGTAAGHLRPQGTDRVAPWTGGRSSPTRCARGISTSAIIYALAAIGLNLHFGYTGLLNFGQVGFMAAGAYGLGITTFTYGWPLWAGILAGLAAGVLLALLLGAPTLRLRADYLAIVTIAAGEIIRIIVRAAVLRDVTGGSNGINGFANEFQEWNPLNPSQEYGGRVFGEVNLEYTGADVWELVVGWTLVGLCVLVMWLLVTSPWGRVLKSIREDEDAARALGKNVFRFKMQSLILGGTFGTIAGMFFAISNNSVQPDNYSTPVTFFALTAAIMGGLGRVGGPVIGVDHLLDDPRLHRQHPPPARRGGVHPREHHGLRPGRADPVHARRACCSSLLMVFRPQGIFGDKREIAIDVRK